MIQTGPQVVGRVPDAQGDVADRGQADKVRTIDFVSRLRIVIDANTVSVTVAEGLDQGYQVRDVLIGPFDFLPDSGKSLVSGWRHLSVPVG
jgi:hypothetical protein